MSFYATMLKLNRQHIKDLKITDIYSIHRVVYDLFDDVRNSEEKKCSKKSGFVFADKGIHKENNNFIHRILVFSDRKPEEREYSKNPREIDDNNKFFKCKFYKFQILINPTKRDLKTKKTVAVKGKDEIKQWFCNKVFKNCGFKVKKRMSQVDKVRILKFKAKDDKQITLSTAKISGVLEVVNSEIFANSVKNGIGRAKAFGCGLLEVMPIK